MRLNRILKTDIRVVDIHEAPLTFHPTLDCHLKEYHYYVCNDEIQMPENRLYSWHFPYPLNFDLMEKAAHMLTGPLNFESFCNVRKNHTYKDYERDVKKIEIVRLPENRIVFKIKGNNFLYKMVRNLVGTILYVGCGKLSLGELKIGLERQDRKAIGVTAKAHGLTLHKLYY